MAPWNGKDEALSATKNEFDAAAAEAPEEGIARHEGRHVDLHRGLKARHITMIGMRICCFGYWREFRIDVDSNWRRYWYGLDCWHGERTGEVSFVKLILSVCKLTRV